jgi:hypothetical protein
VRILVPPFTLASQLRLAAPSRGGLASNGVTVRVRALARLRARRLRRLRLFGTVSPANAAGPHLDPAARGQRPLRAAAARRPAALALARSDVPRRDALTGGALTEARSPIIRLRGGR